MTEERTLILLNEMGDIEISWDPEHDEKMRAVIQKKMEHGVKFFRIKDYIILKKRVYISSPSELKANKISVADEDIEKLFLDGSIRFTRRTDSINGYKVEHVTDPAVAAKSNTVAVRQYKGG